MKMVRTGKFAGTGKLLKQLILITTEQQKTLCHEQTILYYEQAI